MGAGAVKPGISGWIFDESLEDGRLRVDESMQDDEQR